MTGAACVICHGSCGCFPLARPEAQCPFPVVAHGYQLGICWHCDDANSTARTWYVRLLEDAQAARRLAEKY